jgi:S-adenosylmethionine-dependent methyltransferase
MISPERKRTPVCLTSDRNFDDLAPRFSRNIYGGLKGKIRLSVLNRDFQEYLPQALCLTENKPLRILDAGGGQGQFSLPLAACGHELSLCDISAEMLALASEKASALGLNKIEFVHGSIQELASRVQYGELAPYDLVLCHSVLEWVVDQSALLIALECLVNHSGHLSLTFYNRHGLVMKNLLRGKRSTVLDKGFKPSAGSLTPTRPLDPQHVLALLQERDWQVRCHSGIRVFADLLLTEEGRRMPHAELLAMELELSRVEPYRSIGRYQHLLLARRHVKNKNT